MFLILLETSGNQPYIFETNKLRENLGASELLYRASTQWVCEAVTAITQIPLWDNHPSTLQTRLLDPSHNPPIETQPDPHTAVEIIFATSGKALLLTRTQATAQQIIRTITHRALTENCGIDLCGVYQEFDWDRDPLHQTHSHLHQTFAQYHSQKPGIADRALRLPIIADCTTSGLPAAAPAPYNPDQILSRKSLTKSNYRDRAFERIRRLIQSIDPTLRFAETPDQLEASLEQLDRLAIIHADANGLGEIFLTFDQHIAEGHPSNRQYLNQLRAFSIEIDIATRKAFVTALRSIARPDSNTLPLIPLILGGDDLTVLCSGQDALPFTVEFLRAFENETSQLDCLKTIAQNALGKPHLCACAGVAIVKPKFPFHSAYDLAEALLKSAKQVKKIVQWTDRAKPFYPCSAIDFHILYDSSNIDLDSIRERLTVDNHQTQLFNKPYIVSCIAENEPISHPAWVKQHYWDNFLDRVSVFQAQDPSTDRASFPSTQAHQLRQTLFSGRKATEAHFRLLQKRYPEIAALTAPSHSLFIRPIDDAPYGTSYLDALEASDFLSSPNLPHRNLSALSLTSNASSDITV